MAQSRDTARSGANTSATAGKSSGATPPAPTSETPSGRFNLARLSRLLRPRPAASQPAGATGDQAPKRSPWLRFLFGMMILLLGTQLLGYLLIYLDARFPQWHIVHGTLVTLPLLGNMSAFTTFSFAGIAILWFGLYRFNVIPRDPFGARARAAERAAAAKRPATTGASGGTRAARRYSARHAATTTSGKATSARQVAAQARATTSASVSAAVPNGSDSEYERVKAAQRQRRRRATKR